MDELDRMLALARREVPQLRLVYKETVWWMRAWGRLIAPVNPDFRTLYTVVIGSTVYLPREPEQMPRLALARTLAHELVHQLDQRQWGPLFYLSYGGAMPVGRTVRAHWERRAYAVDLMLAHRSGGEVALDAAAERLAALFSGPSYGWMWAGRSSARSFLAPVVEAIREGTLQEQQPYREILAVFVSD